jgi:hypothetical protein
MGCRFNLSNRSTLSCLALFFAGLLAARSAEPCGVIGSREGRRPSLSYEQVLLLHDPATEQEHFIRSQPASTNSSPGKTSRVTLGRCSRHSRGAGKRD